MKKYVQVLISLFAFIISVGAANASVQDGKEVADALNARYEKVVSDCDGNPAFYCSGIVIRVNEIPSYPTWEPYTPGYLKLLQFSYLRKDMTFHKSAVWGYDLNGYGIVLNDRQSGNYSTRCIFPMDGMSTARSGYGCGDFGPASGTGDGDQDNSTCHEKGVDTAEAWVEKYNKHFESSGCSFSSHDATYFNESVKASLLAWKNYNVRSESEFVINTSEGEWSATDPSKDDIQALWFNPGKTDALSGAQKEQQAYYDASGKWVPIVSLSRVDENAVFAYSDDNQKIKPQN